MVEKMKNRIYRTKSLVDFKRFIMRKYHDLSDLEDHELREQL